MKKLLAITLVGGILLSGCGQLDTKSPNTSGIGKEKKDLVWVEMVSNGDEKEITYNISYIKNNKQRYVNAKGNKVVEHILKDPTTQPYVKVLKGCYHIYRQPMNIMYNKEIKGKVEKKEVVNGD